MIKITIIQTTKSDKQNRIDIITNKDEYFQIRNSSLFLINPAELAHGTDNLADNAKRGIIKARSIAYGNQIGGRLYSSAITVGLLCQIFWKDTVRHTAAVRIYQRSNHR